jgi:hypothetical protein
MNDSIKSSDVNQPGDEADALLGEWIREAGDEPMQPTTEHVLQLKERLLAQSSAPAPSTPATTSPPSPARPTRRGWLWAALAGVAAVITFTLLPSGNRQSAAWAQVKEAVNAKLWMHTLTIHENGMIMESWFSPRRLVIATRAVAPADARLDGLTPFAMFVDIRQRARFEYKPQSNEIVKWPMTDSDESAMRMVVGFFSALTDGKGLKEYADANSQVSVAEPREVNVDGRQLLEFDAVVSVQGQQTNCVYRVDPETNLPIAMTVDVGEETLATTIDYPEHGPESIYDLGVQQDVVISDRMPAPELSRILEQRQTARMNFDRYYGYSVEVPPNRQWWNSVNVKRLWRDGNRWRTELMIWDVADLERIQNREAPPAGTDPYTWLSKQIEHERFRPTTLSDGANTWRFEFEAQRSETDPKRFEYTIKSATKNPYAIDPRNPLPTIFTNPEFMVYGPIGLPSSRRQGVLTLHPDDGPNGTIKIESRSTDEPRPQSNDLSYYWVDPLGNGMMRKTQMFSLTGSQPELLGEQTVLETARTPGGFLYPTRLEYDGGSVEHFYLDFDADFDDSVFDPVMNGKAPLPE